jgi:Uma2 family endonuclease
MGAKTLISVEAFDRLEEPDELSYELDEGELVVMTKPRPLHNRIVANLEYELRADPNADIPGAPDLAVEVLSPTDTVSAMRRTIRQYFAAGAQYVWVVYPDTREVEVWREAARPQVVLQETDFLEPPGLLPEFRLRVGALFS